VDETYRFTGTHLSEYDRTKAAAHEIAKQMIAGGLPLVIVMPGLIYGPGDTSTIRSNLIQYLKRKLPILRAGPQCAGARGRCCRGTFACIGKGQTG